MALARWSRFLVALKNAESDLTDAEIAQYQGFLLAASLTLEAATGRVLERPTTDDEYVVDGNGRSRLHLPEWPFTVDTLTEIRLGDTVIDPDDYTLENGRGTETGCYARLASGRWEAGDRNYVVVGTPGYDTTGWDTALPEDDFSVPSLVEEGVLSFALELFKRGVEGLTTYMKRISPEVGASVSVEVPRRGYGPTFDSVISLYKRGGG